MINFYPALFKKVFDKGEFAERECKEGELGFVNKVFLWVLKSRTFRDLLRHFWFLKIQTFLKGFFFNQTPPEAKFLQQRE